MSEDLTKRLPKSDSEKLTLIITTVEALEARMLRLEQKVDERIYDTRPIWHKLVADISELQQGQAQLQRDRLNSSEVRSELQQGQVELGTLLLLETREIKQSIFDLYRGQTVLNDAVLKIHHDSQSRRPPSSAELKCNPPNS